MNRTDLASTALEVAGAAAVVVGVDSLLGAGAAWITAGVLSAVFGYLIGGTK